MIRSLFYHFFWNFYDYLGSYLLLGAIVSGAILGIVTIGGVAGQHLPVAAGVTVLLAVAFVSAILCAGGLAGLFAFADKAAKDEAARLPDFKRGIRLLFARYIKLLLLSAVVAIIAGVDVAGYWKLGFAAKASVWRAAFGVTAMILFWVGLGVYVFVFPAAAAPARFPETRALMPLLRKAFIVFSLYPLFWFTVAFWFSVITAICIVSVVGVLFILPLFASLSCTAFDIAVRRTDFLARAREELGGGVSISAYRRRADELDLEWEARQPKRTFRELIKPWET